MSCFTPRLPATALALLMASGAVQADVTPAEVWGDWRDYMQGMGYAVTANETSSGDTLTVSDIRFAIDMGDAAGEMSVNIGTLDFVQGPGGTVLVNMPPVLPFDVGFTPQGEKPVKISLAYEQSGHRMTVSGTPADMAYDYAADSLAMTLRELQVDGKIMGPDNAKLNFNATNVTSATRMTIGNMRGYDQTFDMGNVTYDIAILPPDAPNEGLKMQGQMAGMKFTGTGTIPLGLVQADDVNKLLDAGFAFNAGFTFESGQSASDFRDAHSAMQMTNQSRGGTLQVAMSNTGIAYSGGQQQLDVTVQVPDLPFPISLSMADAAFKLAAPVKSGDVPQDFALGLRLGGFTMSDMIWGMFDPSSQLPRDPATIDLDLAGKVKLLVDFLDPASAEQMAATGAQPGSVEALNVNRLIVDLVGARLSGDGSFTFDNNDLATFGGVPRPTGVLNLELSGGNGLLDKLVAMGLLPEEQAMGARMMMGLFAVPGASPDTLSSKIEINEQGHILANGQRIQ